MSEPKKILIVEDEMIIGAKISMYLEQMGYEVTGILPRGEEVLMHVKNNPPDIVILDINLKGALNGIQVAQQLNAQIGLPFIFLTANADDAHFEKAKEVKPGAFISKPFKKLDLKRAIELTLSRTTESKELPLDDESEYMLADRIFVRHNDKRVKVMLEDIYFFESDRNYTRIFTNDQEYLLTVTLKTLEDKLPSNVFMRVHRSYIININHLDAIAESHLVINKKEIPFGKGTKAQILERIKLL